MIDESMSFASIDSIEINDLIYIDKSEAQLSNEPFLGLVVHSLFGTLLRNIKTENKVYNLKPNNPQYPSLRIGFDEEVKVYPVKYVARLVDDL
jgi:hypothetical protein